MKHLFKVPLPTADMFVSALNMEDQAISYEVREKDTVKLLETPSTVPFEVIENRISFGGRFINLQYAEEIAETLK